MKQLQIKAGEVFIEEGEDPGPAYFLDSGKMTVFKNKGQEKIHIAEIHKGSIIGELSLIDNKPRSTTVKALENCVVTEIPRESIKSIVQNKPEITLALIETLSERLRNTLRLLEK